VGAVYPMIESSQIDYIMKLSAEQQRLVSELNDSFNRSHEDSVWIDGFCNYLLHGHSSNDDDNTYDKEREKAAYLEYSAGAKAAEEFVKYLDKSE
jgi:hypothetical protein